MLTVRLATPEDMTDVLVWRSDPLAIKMSLSGTEVSAEEHRQWFPRTLDNDEHVHLIGEFVTSGGKVEKVGVCRFDRQELNRWIVSINLKPSVRGRGLSGAFLDQAIRYLKSSLPSSKLTLAAEIKKQNIPSMKIFQRNGFQPVRRLLGTVQMERELN